MQDIFASIIVLCTLTCEYVVVNSSNTSPTKEGWACGIGLQHDSLVLLTNWMCNVQGGVATVSVDTHDS